MKFLSELVNVISVKGASTSVRSLRGVETAFDRAVASSHRMDASLSRMSRAMSDATTLAFRLGAAFTVGGLGLGAFFKQGSDFEQTEVAFETMLQSAEKAQKTLADLQEFARRTPFNFTQVADLSKRLLAFSFTAEELIPTMNDLGNIAAGVGREKLPQLILALGQVRTAGTLRGQELRQFTEAGVPLLEELAKTTGRVKEEIQDMVHAGEISYGMVRESIANLSKEGGRFHNLMIRQSTTLGGMFSNLIDYLQMLAIRLGKKGLLNEAKNFLSDIISMLETNEEQVLERANQMVQAVIKGMRGIVALGRAAGHVFRGFASMVGGTEKAINLLIIAMTALAGARMLSILGNFSMGLMGVVRSLLALQGTALAIPLLVGAAIAALALIVEDVIAFFQGRESVTGLLMKDFESVSKGMEQWADKISDKIHEKIKSFAKTIGSVLESDEFKDILDKWVDTAIVAGGVAFKIGAAIASGIISGIWAHLSGQADEGAEGPQQELSMWDKIKNAGGKVADLWNMVPAVQAGNWVYDNMSAVPFGAVKDTLLANMRFGQGSTNINIGDIVVPPGLTPEQAQQVVSRGVQDGIDRSELRRAVRAGESPVAY